MKKILLLLLFSQTLQAQEIVSDSLKIEGIYRSFHFQQPIKKAKGYSLVFVLHGSGGNGLQMRQRVSTFHTNSDQEGLIAVYPTGYKNFWNECRKMSPADANMQNVNEEAFFTGMIAYFRKKYGIDPSKVFAVGTSGGGHMAFKLAMMLPERFHAITAIIANLPEEKNLDCSALGKPMNVMIVNGTEDKINPYMGGDVILASGNFGAVRSTDNTFHYWSSLAGYSGAPAHQNLPDTNPKDGKTIEEFSHTGREKSVVLLKVNGGKHDYPGDIDVHLKAWEFFKSTMGK